MSRVQDKRPRQGHTHILLFYVPVHGWNYRRYILLQLAVPKDFKLPPGVAPFPQSLHESQELSPLLKQHQLSLAHREIKYTLSKIESNFSNFSAWHQRSLILPGIWAAEEMDEEARRKARDEEFELVRQAMFVDPDDQSVWTYHQWLVDLGELMAVCLCW